jgi:hypothetical protein
MNRRGAAWFRHCRGERALAFRARPSAWSLRALRRSGTTMDDETKARQARRSKLAGRAFLILLGLLLLAYIVPTFLRH